MGVELCHRDKSILEPTMAPLRYGQYQITVPARKCPTCGEVYIPDESMREAETTARRIKEAKVKETIGLMPDTLLTFPGIVLKRLSEGGRPMSVSEIAQIFLEEERYETFEAAKSAVIRALGTLEAHGLVGKMPGPRDRRERFYASIRAVPVPQLQAEASST